MRHFLLHQHHLFAMQTDTFAIPMQEHSNNPIISDNEYHDKKQHNEPRKKIWHKGIPGGCCSHSPVNRIRMGYRQADFHRQHLAPPVGRQRFYPAVLILRPENRTIRHKPGSRHMGRRQPRCISGFRRHNKQADIISDDTCRRQYNHLPPSGFRIFRTHRQRREYPKTITAGKRMHISRIFLFLCLLSLEAFLCTLKFGFILLILTLHFCIFFAQFFLLFKKFLLFFLYFSLLCFKLLLFSV